MQTTLQHLSGIWSDILSWAAVLAGLATIAGVVALFERRRRAPPRANAAEAAAGIDREREWELVMRRAVADLARAPDLAALQARAVLKIEAAEHAYNRLAADYARLSGHPAAPAFEAKSQLAREPEEQPERQPLAA